MLERHLFKAKRMDNDEWVKGGLCESSWGSCFIITNELGEVPDTVKVNPDTICQCTGLKDKSGKLIWENDIVKHYNDEAHPESYCTGTVLWDENYAGFYRTSNEYGLSKPRISSDCIYEVVGNVFDNLEMLEGSHDGE